MTLIQMNRQIDFYTNDCSPNDIILVFKFSNINNYIYTELRDSINNASYEHRH